MNNLKVPIEVCVAFYANLQQDFDSHELILKMAQANQTLYIAALVEAAGVRPQDPFRHLHAQISKYIGTLKKKYRMRQVDTTSADIFGEPASCALWKF